MSETKIPRRELSFQRQAAFVIGLSLGSVILLGLLVQSFHFLLLAFAGVLGGVLLSALTSSITRRLSSIPRPVALALVLSSIAGATAGAGLLLGPALYEQSVQLSRELPPVIRSLSEQVSSSDIAQQILSPLPSTDELVSGTEMTKRAASAFASVGGVFGAGLFVLVSSVFFAAQPQSYTAPAIRLVPPAHRGLAENLLEKTGANLRNWMVARFISMLAVALLTGLGLWILGIPAWVSLALLAGVLSFIPNLGPILSALPGILLGLSISPATAAWAAGIYVAVQVIEGNLINPFLQQRAVSIPPAYLLAAQLLMGLTMGALGLMVATPFVVVAVVLVRGLYVERLEEVAQGPQAGLVLPSGS